MFSHVSIKARGGGGDLKRCPFMPSSDISLVRLLLLVRQRHAGRSQILVSLQKDKLDTTSLEILMKKTKKSNEELAKSPNRQPHKSDEDE
jgi:hypothetical protein